METEQLKKIACDAIDKASVELNNLSQDIWSHPELCFEEKYCHEVLSAFLEKYEFSVERNYILDTAFRATVGEKEEGQCHVSVLCEYDALPNIGHACGHNLIAEVGVAAGIGIKAAMEGADRKLGKLTVLGTPAEEGGNGKQLLINGGAFEGMNCSLMAHPAKFNIVEKDWLAHHLVIVKYKGKASHAAAFPWEGLNALDAAVMAYQNIAVLRQQMKPSWRIGIVITNGGAKPNIIPEEAEIRAQIRTLSLPELKILKDKVESCFLSAAQATGCQVDVHWNELPYMNVITNKTLGKLYTANAINTGVTFDEDVKEIVASTDMGNVSHVLPSIHPVYSIGDALNHTREFTTLSGDQRAQGPTLQTAKAIAMTAVDVLVSSSLASQMEKDFEEDIRREN